MDNKSFYVENWCTTSLLKIGVPILMMKETLNEARRGYIESRLAEYTAEVLRRGDPSSCLFFLREFHVLCRITSLK